MIANLTLIQTFYQVAREGSYSAAARNLGLTYQSVTNHIRRLEQLLGAQLINAEKGGKHISLTPYARSLYSLLHPELDLMLSRLSLLIEANRPILRVGLPQSIFFYLLPKVLLELQQNNEGIELQAMERDTMLRELVKDGSLDICISESHFADPNVPQRLLGVYPLRLIVPKTWQILPDPENIAVCVTNRPFITYEPGQILRHLSKEYLRQLGIVPEVSVSTSGSSSVKRCVEVGLGYSIIPDWCIDPVEPFLESCVLSNFPQVPIYFGYIDFLSNSALVNKIFEACQKYFAERLSVRH